MGEEIMKFKKIMFVSILLLAILAIGAVSASDENVTDELTVDEDLSLEIDDGDKLAEEDSSETLSESGNSSGTFDELSELIKDAEEGSVLNLTKDYVDDREYVGITVSKSITIDGHNHILDTNWNSDIFRITADSVILKNIVFKNGFSHDEDGGNIKFEGSNDSFVNCTFIDCDTTYLNGANGSVVNCTFINYSYYTAIRVNGFNGIVNGCTFINLESLCVYFSGNNCLLSKCSFLNCSVGRKVDWGGDNGILSDCSFINCSCEGRNDIVVWGGNDGTIIHSFFENTTSSGSRVINWNGKGGKIKSSVFNYCSIPSSPIVIYVAPLVYDEESYSQVDNVADVMDCDFKNDGTGKLSDLVCNSNVTNCTLNGISQKSFDELKSLIDAAESGGVLELENDFVSCRASLDKITISKRITIDGKNHTLDASQISGIFEVKAYSVSLKNINFINAKSIDDGGAIRWYGGYGNVSNCSFINCQINDRDGFYGGGAIAWHGTPSGEAHIDNCRFIDCRSTEKAGAIVFYEPFVMNSNYYLSNCSFVNCNARSHGGAIYASDECNLYISNCSFSNNHAKELAGAVFATEEMHISDSSFINNSADDEGGAILEAFRFSVSNCSFINNTAANKGGAIYSNEYYTGSVADCYFNLNSAKYGGAIHECTAVNCEFRDNNAEYGGAMYSGTAILCIFENNDCINTKFFPIMEVSDFKSKYGSGEKLLFNVTYDNQVLSGLNTSINVYQNNTLVGTYYCLSGDGWLVDLNPGTYKAILSLEKYPEISSDNVTLKILSDKLETVIAVSPVTTAYNADDYLVASLKDGDGNALIGFDVSVDFNGVKTLTTDGNGQVKVSTNGLVPNIYDVVVSFAGNENYTESANTTKVAVDKGSTKLSAANVTAVYNVDKDLVVTLTDANGNALSGFDVSVDFNSVRTLTTDGNGQVKVSISGLAPNTYNVTVAFAGNENYTESNTTTTVVINKDSTKLAASAVATVYNVNKNLVVTLKDSQGRALNGVTVSVNINGAKTYTTKNGQVKIAVGSLAPKTYTAKISFAGNDNYNATSANVKVTVKKATPKLTAKAKTFKKSVKTKKYSITLKTNQNKVMKNTKLTLKVNGKTYSATTNAKGQATFKITKLTKKGKFTAVVKFAGNKYYNAKTVKPKITIK